MQHIPDENDVHDQAEEVHAGAGEKDGSPGAEGHVVLWRDNEHSKYQT